MTQMFERITKRYANALGVLIGFAVVSSILLYSGCGSTSRPNIPTNPTPTPTPTPPPTPTPTPTPTPPPSPTPTPTPDTTPPTVTMFFPADKATDVPVDTDVKVTFSEAMDATTINVSTMELLDPSNTTVLATVSYDAGSFTATL